MELVFVYGTLKRGFGNARLLADSKFLKEDTVPGRLYFLGHHAFPYAIPALTSTIYLGFPRIHGEVFIVHNTVLDKLDRLEGTPNHYERVLIKTDSELSAWMYIPSEQVRLYASWIEVILSGLYNPATGPRNNSRARC
ncbi:MAG: gamma-glutamylcyclotransferase [Nitrososphaera sp.]|nr:gamma-glutamylcyclotransferase [Nitrososphaera sp.]